MKKTAIFKAIMALFVIMLGVNFNADAQIGKNLLDKATDAAKGVGEGAIKQKWEIIVFFSRIGSLSKNFLAAEIFYILIESCKNFF